MQKYKFFVENGHIRIYRFQVKHWIGGNISKMDSELCESISVANYLILQLKKLGFEFFDVTPLDVTDIEWMDGIFVDDSFSEALRIYEMGEQAYLESLRTTPENYALDLDYRLSKIELGL